MTLEQITRMKDLAYGIGGGIACLVIAYPYAFTTSKEGNLAASYLVDHIMLGERLLALLLDVGLVLVTAISFIVAGWAAPQVARRRCSARS